MFQTPHVICHYTPAQNRLICQLIPEAFAYPKIPT